MTPGSYLFIFYSLFYNVLGLKSAGAKLTEGIEKDQIVAVMAEGKDHAMAIGQQKMSSEEIKTAGSGSAIDSLHFLQDGIYRIVIS